MTDAELLKRVKQVAQDCLELAAWCEGRHGYVEVCLDDARTALDLATNRLCGVSTLSDRITALHRDLDEHAGD